MKNKRRIIFIFSAGISSLITGLAAVLFLWVFGYIDFGDHKTNDPFIMELIGVIERTESEDKVRLFLDGCVRNNRISGKDRERYERMVFWRNFVSLQAKKPCLDLEALSSLFQNEKRLKNAWFQLHDLSFIDKETSEAERRWREIAARCKSEKAEEGKSR